ILRHVIIFFIFFFFSSRRRHTRSKRDWSSDVCSSDLRGIAVVPTNRGGQVTYHGPGQVVVYPLIDLRRLNIYVKEYVFRLEQARSEERRVGKECRSRWSPEH